MTPGCVNLDLCHGRRAPFFHSLLWHDLSELLTLAFVTGKDVNRCVPHKQANVKSCSCSEGTRWFYRGYTCSTSINRTCARKPGHHQQTCPVQKGKIEMGSAVLHPRIPFWLPILYVNPLSQKKLANLQLLGCPQLPC